MLNSFKKFVERVEELYKQYEKLITAIEKAFWKDEQPADIKGIPSTYDDDPLKNFKLGSYTKGRPAQKKIPEKLRRQYHVWYSSCCALLERNYNKERAGEFKSLYDNGIKDILSGNYITLDKEHKLIDALKHQASILQALPGYLECKVSDVELTIASILMDDELAEAEYLVKKGFCRAAGALAGVVLERHLKMLCDKNSPKLRYPKKTATINKLNDILKNNGVLDIVEWRRIQYLADIRNKCDHDKEPPPKVEEVRDLISGVKALIH